MLRGLWAYASLNDGNVKKIIQEAFRCAIFDAEMAYALQGWTGHDNER